MWTGDVWKTVVALREFRPDLVVRTIDLGPTGLTLVTNLNPASTVLRDQCEHIFAHLADRDYGELERNRDATLTVVSCSPRAVRPLLPKPFRAPSPWDERVIVATWSMKAFADRLIFRRLRPAYWFFRARLGVRGGPPLP
jgi:hypothetical protein